MELIPTSNRKQNIDLLDVNQYYNMRKEVTLNPGDVLMFEMATIIEAFFIKNKNHVVLFNYLIPYSKKTLITF